MRRKVLTGLILNINSVTNVIIRIIQGCKRSYSISNIYSQKPLSAFNIYLCIYNKNKQSNSIFPYVLLNDRCYRITLSKSNKYPSLLSTGLFFGNTPQGDFPAKKKSYGTGSMPPGLNGWHLRIRLTAKYPPFNEPCLAIASYA